MTRSRSAAADVELHQHLAPRLERALQQGVDLSMAWRFSGSS